SRILIIATTRPEHRPLRSSGVEVLSLAPLGLPECLTLLDDWLGSDDMLAPLCARIEARARGNPLFVEEMIRSLVEGGVLRGERGAYGLAAPTEEITLPETVQAGLASRLDRLADRAAAVLHAAAVVGRDVPREVRGGTLARTGGPTRRTQRPGRWGETLPSGHHAPRRHSGVP